MTEIAATAPSRPKLAYVHIGKSGGTSLVTMLKSAFQPDRVCPAIFLNEFTLAEDWADQAKYDIWCGHMGYNHAARVSPTIVTILRNPIDRILSLYYYWRSVTSETQGPQLAKRYPIEEFLDLEERATIEDVRNTQAWQLAADHSVETRDSLKHLSEDDLFQRARRNLDSMAFVGVNELFPQASAAIMKIAGGPETPSVRVNVTPDRVPSADISMHLRRKIMRRCEIDMALYDYALLRFNSQALT